MYWLHWSCFFFWNFKIFFSQTSSPWLHTMASDSSTSHNLCFNHWNLHCLLKHSVFSKYIFFLTYLAPFSFCWISVIFQRLVQTLSLLQSLLKPSLGKINYSLLGVSISLIHACIFQTLTISKKKKKIVVLWYCLFVFVSESRIHLFLSVALTIIWQLWNP